MTYPSPKATDFTEVAVLNKAFLRLLCSETEATTLLGTIPVDIGSRLAGLDDTEAARLAAAPFLLFSLRESDDDYWDEVRSDAASYSLFRGASPECSDKTRLVAAALGYVWQMARLNPYTLRLICCASLHWCERIAEQPLMHVINRATVQDDLIGLRAGSDAGFWGKLLAGGLDPCEDVRKATCYSALQTLLIAPPPKRQGQWRSAACKTRTPAMTITMKDKGI